MPPPSAAAPKAPAPPPIGMAVPGLVVALAQIGDSLLYAVLPLYADAFGVSLAVVGLLLSLNRWVRLVANSVVAAIGDRVGPKRLMLVAAAGGAVSTAGYAIGPNEAALMVWRVLWGLSFAGLNLAVLAYAVSDRANAGKRVAAGRTAIGMCQTAVLVLGTMAVVWLGPRGVFLAVAGISCAAIWLACTLPGRQATAEPGEGFRLPWPGRLEIWGFSLGLVVDGIFVLTLSLLLKDNPLPLAPVVATGVLLAARAATEVVTAPVGGALADRFGARGLSLIAGAVLVLGLTLIAGGYELAGATLVVTMRGLFNTLVPVLVAARNRGGMLSSQANYATWRDFGAAVGPVVAGLVYAAVPQGPLYAVCAMGLAGALWWCVGRR